MTIEYKKIDVNMDKILFHDDKLNKTNTVILKKNMRDLIHRSDIQKFGEIKFQRNLIEVHSSMLGFTKA